MDFTTKKGTLRSMCDIAHKGELPENFTSDLLAQYSVKEQVVAEFFKAVIRGDHMKVNEMLDVNSMMVFEVDDRMQTPLHLAIRYK